MISTPRLLSSHLSDLCKKKTTGGVLDLRFIVTLYATSSYDSIATVGEIQVYWRADFQSGSRVLKKVF